MHVTVDEAKTNTSEARRRAELFPLWT